MIPVPERKLVTGGLAGSFSVVLIWLIHELTGVAVPAEVAAGLATILSGVTSWVTPA